MFNFGRPNLPVFGTILNSLSSVSFSVSRVSTNQYFENTTHLHMRQKQTEINKLFHTVIKMQVLFKSIMARKMGSYWLAMAGSPNGFLV